MSKKNIKEVINDFVSSISVKDTIYFQVGKENKASLSETEDLLSININEDQIELFKYSNTDELEELNSWDVFESIVLKGDTIKGFILNTNDLLDQNVIFEGSAEKLGYKIIVDQGEVLENLELFIANIGKIMDLLSLKEKCDKYAKLYEKFMKEKKLCVFEVSNLRILDKLKDKILMSPIDFLRTSLVIINEEFNCQLSIFEFDESYDGDVEKVSIKPVSLPKYHFYSELLCFLESAQKMKHNHLKYIDYYHVLEYFITDYAYKNLEDSIKKLISFYLEGATYEEFRRILVKITEENKVINLGQDQPLFDVLKQIDLQYIIEIINKNKLFDMLKQDIFGIENTRLITNKMVRGDMGNITKVEVDKDNEEEFYKKLYYRLYSIRNVLIHSKAKFRGKKDVDFLPVPKYEGALKEDIILIKALAINLCKIKCIDIKE